MNRKIALTFAVATFAAAGAFAETPLVDTAPFQSTLTRDQVRMELSQQRQAGTNVYGDGYDPQATFRSSRTRGEVTAEFLAERDAVSALNGEDSGSVYLARREQPRPAGRQLAAR